MNLKENNEKISILIAEDDDINYIYFAELLDQTKYNLIRAIDGEQAVDLCKENQAISLVLMDLKMPVLNGFEAFRQIRELNQKIPVIAQTAYALSDDEKKIKEAGFTDYITKPIVEETLLEMIEKYTKTK